MRQIQKQAMIVCAMLILSGQAKGDRVTYDFDALNGSGFPGTTMVGQDGWSAMAGTTAAAGFTVRSDLAGATNNHITGNGTYATSSSQLARVNDGNFSFPTVIGNTLALEFTLRGSPGGNSFAHFTLGHDANNDGTLSFPESGPALGFINGRFFIRVATANAPQTVATEQSLLNSGDVWEARMEIDFSANGGDGAGSVFARALNESGVDVSGTTTLQPVAGLQNLNLKISNMAGAGADDPTQWDAMLIRGNGGTSLDNLVVETIPTPSAFGTGIVLLGGMVLKRRRN